MDVPTTIVKPGEGRSVWLGGMGVVFKVSLANAGSFIRECLTSAR
jgi:hypothetical protein